MLLYHVWPHGGDHFQIMITNLLENKTASTESLSLSLPSLFQLFLSLILLHLFSLLNHLSYQLHSVFQSPSLSLHTHASLMHHDLILLLISLIAVLVQQKLLTVCRAQQSHRKWISRGQFNMSGPGA